MCLIAKNFELHEENINISKLMKKTVIRKTGWVTTDQKERERLREDAVLYEKGGRKPDNNNNNGRNGSFKRGWLPHRGKAQMACKCRFPTRTMFSINSEFGRKGMFR